MGQRDLTQGAVFPTMGLFALPMILGNLLQQCYNIVDSWVALSYALAPRAEFGVAAIWWSIPTGWVLADLTGFLIYMKNKDRLPAPASPGNGIQD